MQANTAGAISPYDSDVAQTVNAFVDSVTGALASVDADCEVIEDVADAGDDVANAVEQEIHEKDDEIEQLRDQIEDNEDEIEDNEDEIEDEIERRSAEIEGCHARITNIEDEIDELEPEDSGAADSGDSNPQGIDEETTALEQVCALPEHVVADNLTANQRRARSVARRIEEYGKNVPAGVAITSSRIKRVLTAQEDTTIHRQTVSRVADFLEQFGDGSVQIKETRGGKTTVVFDEQLVDAVTGVVTDNTGTGVTPASI